MSLSITLIGEAKDSHAIQQATASPLAGIIDSDWDFKKITTTPKERSFARCNGHGLCWLWSKHSIWLIENGSKLRQVYLVEEQATADSLIGNVFFLSPSMGWMTKPGALYHTQDGGTTWNRVPVPENMGPVDVDFRDDQVGCVVGSRYRPLLKDEPMVNNALSSDRKSILTGIILETSDGGTNWRAPNLRRMIGGFGNVGFHNNLGVAFGDAGCLVTADGGRRWTEVLTKFRQKGTGELPEAMSAFLLDDSHGWITLSGAEIIATRDGGISWNIVYGPTESEPHVSPDTLTEIAFLDPSNGLAINREPGGGRLFKTSDGGKSWTKIHAEERFWGLELSGATRKGILIGNGGVYSLSFRS